MQVLMPTELSNTTPSTLHLQAVFNPSTSLHQSSLRIDQKILTPKILIIIHL